MNDIGSSDTKLNFNPHPRAIEVLKYFYEVSEARNTDKNRLQLPFHLTNEGVVLCVSALLNQLDSMSDNYRELAGKVSESVSIVEPIVRRQETISRVFPDLINQMKDLEIEFYKNDLPLQACQLGNMRNIIITLTKTEES